MHLTSGHVTLLTGKFSPFEFFPQSDFRHWVDLVGLCPKFLALICFFSYSHFSDVVLRLIGDSEPL